MTRRNELVKKAKTIQSPLAFDEVKNLVASAPKAYRIKPWPGKGFFMALALLSGIAAAGFFFWWEQKHVPTQTNNRSAHEAPDADENAAGKGALKMPETNNQPAEHNEERNTPDYAEKTSSGERNRVEGYGYSGTITVPPFKGMPAEEEPGVGESAPNPYADLAALSVSSMENKKIGMFLSNTPLEIERKDSTLRKRNKYLNPKPWPKNFVRTDLWGHVSGMVVVEFLKGWDKIDFSPYISGRRSLGYERMFHRRLSLDLVAAYGFTDDGVYASVNATDGNCYINYKGWMFHVGARFYPISRPNGSGVFLGPYASLGLLSERYILHEKDPNGADQFSLLGVNKGTSVGLGGYIGGRLVVRRVFIEASTGFPFRGKDFGYSTRVMGHNFGMDGQRYENLHRLIEFSLGYSF